MPELPEVETIVRTLRVPLIGRTIVSADLLWKRSLATPSPARFTRLVTGQRITNVSRRGKFINIHLSDSHMLIHLRMSGDLLVVLGGYLPARHDRMILKLSEDTSLIFSDPRKFGRVWLTADAQEILSGLGPEPLSDEFTSDWLHKALNSRHRQIKPLLLDQSFIAGLGNIYTDEALFRAKIHPQTLSNTLTRERASALRRSIRAVLKDGIRRNGASIDWVYRGGNFQNYFRVYGRTGEPCPVCGEYIQRITLGQRGTHFCPRCQGMEVKNGY